MKRMLAVLLLLAGYARAGSTTNSPRERFQAALELQKKGDLNTAFKQYLTIPGAGHSAVALARPEPNAYLAALADAEGSVLPPIAKIIEGDLHLAKRENTTALKLYRETAALIASDEQREWTGGRAPFNYYFVEPPSSPSHLAKPFELGPGSHRDNWLIRRFITLNAMDDAEKEFERIWTLYKKAKEPRVELLSCQDPIIFGSSTNTLYLRSPEGYDGRGLQFAVDYAYFLFQRDKQEQALALLLEPLRAMDMDVNPDLATPLTALSEKAAARYPQDQLVIPPYRHYSWDPQAILSRNDFIRLAYGEFKKSGHEREFIGAFEKQIATGELRARRVLARVLLLQNKPDEALKQELAFIAEKQFPPFTTAYRRGMVYEDHQLPAQAAVEYEKLLGLTPTEAVSLPDPESVKNLRVIHPEDWTNPNARWLRVRNMDAVDRLQRIYVAQGETGKLLSLTLARMKADPENLADFNLVQDAAKRFRAAGRTDEYTVWASEQIGESASPVTQANLYWSLNDPDRALTALSACGSVHDLEWWKSRFKERGRLIGLYNLILALNPADADTRVKRLNMEDDPLTADAIDDLERLLAPNANHLFDRNDRTRHDTRFSSNHDHAYRLMRLYEKEGRIDALLALGLHVAEGDKPFTPLGEIDRDDYYFRDDDNGWEGDLLGCLSLLIHHADTATMTRLEGAWKDLPDFPSKQQLARKRRGGFAPQTAPLIPWANLPEGIEALASSENVLSLAADEAYVYSGHPWGIAVYDHEGTPLVRVALGAAATTIEPHAGHVWIGSPLGLWRVEPETWRVAHLPMDQDIPAKRRTEEYARPNNRVHTLAADGDTLWIGTPRDIRRLDLAANEMRVFSPRELGIKSREWNRVLVEKNYIWFTGYDASLRYDRKTETWAQVKLADKPAYIIGDLDGTLWGHVHVGQPLRDRPCKIDRDTLEVTPVLIHGNLNESQQCINGPFGYFGTYRGDPVFATSQLQYMYNAEIEHLIPIKREAFLGDVKSEMPAAIRRSDVWRDTQLNWHGRYASRGRIAGIPFHSGRWTLLTLPNGVRILGGARDGSPNYGHSSADYPFSTSLGERSIHSGGLLFLPPHGVPRRVSALPAANAIASDIVYAVTPTADHERLWLCGDSGVTVLGKDRTILENIQRENGARASRVTFAVVVGNQTYFSLDAKGGRGGVMVHDTESNVFTALTMADGLAEPRVVHIEINDGALFAEYREPPKGGRAFAQYDPAANIFTPPNTPRTAPSDRPWKRRWDEPPPLGYDSILGGSVVSTTRVDGATYYCGTRGVVIVTGELPAAPVPDPLAINVLLDESVRLRAEAEEMEQSVQPKTLEQLREWLKHPNPFVRGMAFRSVEYQKPVQDSAELPPLVATHAAHPEPYLRKHALQTLARSPRNTETIPIFQQALADSNPEIRALATIALCDRSTVPPTVYLEEVYERNTFIERMNEAIAPHATPQVFELLLQLRWPPRYENYDYAETVFPPLGASLVRHPEAANLLLKAYDTDKYNPEKRNFAQHVFQFTGTNLLPNLHVALESNDRVVRSNAARACGAICDPSSIEPLLQAMNLDSGLSRASIVWALGELNAKEALPMLETLYVDLRNDEERTRHAGYRTGQLAAALQTQYVSMRNIDSVGKEWNELKASAAPKPIQPRENEDLLSTTHLLEAIGKIDPTAAQGFYRTLTSDKRADIRRVAAEQLALAEDGDRAANIPILHALLADQDNMTRVCAAISLIILGDAAPETYVLEWLEDDDYSMRIETLKQSKRVGQVSRLAFARPALETIAAGNPSNHDDVKQATNLLERLNDEIK